MIKEPELKIKNIEGLRYDIELIVHTISGESGTIKTHKALLVMYSEVFNTELTGEFSEFIKNGIDLGYKVSNINIMDKLITSFYNRNTSRMISGESLKNKLELLRICHYYDIKIPILSLLAEIIVDKEYEDFMDTVIEINPYDEEWQLNIIATKIAKNYILESNLLDDAKDYIKNRLSYLVLVMEDEVIFKDLASNKDIFRIEGNDYKSAVYSRDKRKLALLRGYHSKDIEIWEMDDIIPKKLYEKELSGRFFCISPDGSHFVFVENRGHGVVGLILVNISTDEIKELKINNIPKIVTISPSNKYIACYICEGLRKEICELIILNSDTGEEINREIVSSIVSIEFISDLSIVMLDEIGNLIVNQNFIQRESKYTEYDLYGYNMSVTADKIIIESSGETVIVVKLENNNIDKTIIKLDERFKHHREWFGSSNFYAVHFNKFRELNVYNLFFGDLILHIRDQEGRILSVAI